MQPTVLQTNRIRSYDGDVQGLGTGWQIQFKRLLCNGYFGGVRGWGRPNRFEYINTYQVPVPTLVTTLKFWKLWHEGLRSACLSLSASCPESNPELRSGFEKTSQTNNRVRSALCRRTETLPHSPPPKLLYPLASRFRAVSPFGCALTDNRIARGTRLRIIGRPEPRFLHN
jgi:hypothetical protein